MLSLILALLLLNSLVLLLRMSEKQIIKILNKVIKLVELLKGE